MADEKMRAFHLEAMREAIERTRPELTAASTAAHAAKADEDDPDFDRLVELGLITDVIGRMCPPDLAVVHRIAQALCELHAHADEDAPRPELSRKLELN